MTNDHLTCSGCGADIHPLDVFPNTRCLACYERDTAHLDPRDLLNIITETFGGKGVKQ